MNSEVEAQPPQERCRYGLASRLIPSGAAADDYSMGVAPHGREGIFTALASAPLFAAMLPTGMISGALLQAYCPDHGQCTEAGAANSPGRRLLSALAGRGLAGGGGGTSAAPGGYECDGRALWTIVALITLSSPLAVLLTQARSGSPVCWPGNGRPQPVAA